MRIRRIPLAWNNLVHDRRRLGVALAGICFAVVLMFIQLGFQNALFDSQVKLIDDLDQQAADLVMVSRAKYALPVRKRFPLSRLYQALSSPRVVAAYPVYLETGIGLLRKAGRYGRNIRVVGVNLDNPVLKPDVLRRSRGQLQPAWTALIDDKSKVKSFPFDLRHPERLPEAEAELSGRPVRLVGVFSLGTDFATEGTLLMSERNFARYFPLRAPGDDPLSIVDVGVLSVRPGEDPAAVAAELQPLLPDVDLCTREQFRRREVAFWDKSTPIGMIFSIGTVLGFVVGTIICYQIIFTDIADHMPEYATLKAMGYPNRYFLSLIVTESLYLSLLGFLPGVLLSWCVYRGLAAATGLMMSMLPWTRVLRVLLMTVAMCIASGMLAIRKLSAADPADLF